ncbi:HDOD domain-containing protein [Thiorhodococcus mannitoliphagus]|uniref:HDOD domain-containing protein n=1 Tax=Thiorhodococcus mannitoliphagus TaxID=329406 RepID=A0A6P1E1G8_9GAMM|nr:HDOD domain-containing protein [Thiorhodococcus mannitoliphagus]NEX23729.1 HDOD domain-containing protein [Thiorhodococcus mannitoliphagus]
MTSVRDRLNDQEIFVARQPIYDREMGVIGYELLYRHGNVDYARIDDGDLASSAVISGSFLQIGIDTLVGSALAFVNVPRRFIIDPSLAPFFEGQVVVEILQDVEPEAEVIDGLKRLKALGHKISLDDFVYRPGCEPLLELADYIKLDVLRYSSDQLREALHLLRDYGAAIIAEKVETPELHRRCTELGFDYFQGFFYCRPKTVRHRVVGANQAVVLQLLQQLQDPEVDLRDVERVLAQDVGLAYKLLRYVNSATFARRREVESLREALVLVGLDRVRDWSSLILMGRMATGKPSELMIAGMLRAYMCEWLAERYWPEIRDQMFVVGLLSIIDALLDSDMMSLLDNLCVSMPIKLALLDGEGPQGELLRRVIAYQEGDWEQISQCVIPCEAYVSAYIEALKWTDEAMKLLLEGRG